MPLEQLYWHTSILELSPTLEPLKVLTNDCMAKHPNKLANPAVVVLVTKRGENANKDKVRKPKNGERCKVNTLFRNITKLKGMVVDFRKSHTTFLILSISSFKFLVVYISHNLSRAQNIFHIITKAHLYSLKLTSTKMRAKCLYSFN